MPRLPDEVTETAFYLYPDRPTAEAGNQVGGTGFVVAREFLSPSLKGRGALFTVSNRHVVENHGASVMRLLKMDGTIDIIELMPDDWVAHPTADLVATCGYVDPLIHRMKWAIYSHFVTREAAKSYSIGIGDDVFMVGRFIGHDGKTHNRPSVRFGNISIGAANIFNPELGHEEESYGVEMRSKPGYSGSPVFVYGTPQLNPKGQDLLRVAQRFILLLGVEWGHITERRPVLNKDGRSSGQYTTEASGMNGVVPAWHLHDLLNTPRLMKRFSEIEERALKANKDRRGEVEPLGARLPSISDAPKMSEVDAENPQHREDFNRLLGAAAKRPKSSG